MIVRDIFDAAANPSINQNILSHITLIINYVCNHQNYLPIITFPQTICNVITAFCSTARHFN